MVKLNIYKKFLGVAGRDSLVDKFIETIVDTNRSYSFFVDWQKVKKQTERYNVEINILNSLIGSKNLATDFKSTIKKYPEVLPVIPLLIAVRKIRLKVIEDFSATDVDIREFDFKKRVPSDEDVEHILRFCKKTGIFDIFSDSKVRNLRDYIFGVEVGMDTNARKNRSGTAMELILTPALKEVQKDFNFDLVSQRQFSSLSNLYPTVSVPRELKDRKFDYVLLKNNVWTNIEINYYAGGGSKPQEIVDSYINRMNELKNFGWHFIWITDGDGWLSGKSQIHKAFEKQDYILNINFIRKGMLRRILQTLFS